MSLRGRRQITALRTRAEEFLVVICGATHFAITADAVRTVVNAEDGDTESILRTCGIMKPPCHLAERFGLPGSDLSPDSRLLVCKNQDGLHEAFRVDRVLGLRELNTAAIMTLPPHFAGPERQWFRGICPFDDTVAVVVNMRWLFGPDHVSPSLPNFAATPRHNAARSNRVAMAVPAGPTWQTIELEEAADGDDAPWAEI